MIYIEIIKYKLINEIYIINNKIDKLILDYIDFNEKYNNDKIEEYLILLDTKINELNKLIILKDNLILLD